MRLPAEILPGMTLSRAYTGNSGTYWYKLHVGPDQVPLTNFRTSRLPAYKVAAWVKEHLAGYDWTQPTRVMQCDPKTIGPLAKLWRDKLPHA